MALTTTEQLNILNGVITPPESTLEDLVKQSAVVTSISFRNSLKNTTDNDLATEYLKKLNSVISLLYHNSNQTIQKLKVILVALYAPQGDYTSVQNAPQSGWENFISGNSLNAMEELGLITAAEKTAYDSI